MTSEAHPIFRTAAVHFCLLCCDVVIWACVWTALLWLDGEGSLDLWCLWALRAISCVVLYSLSTIFADSIIDILSGKYQHTNFSWAIGLMALCSFGSSMFGGMHGGMFMCSLSRLNKRIRHMLFQNLMKQEMSFFEENKPGSLTSRLISDTDKMGRSVAMNVNVLLRSLVKTCGMLFFMLRLSWQLTLLTCIEMPLLAFIQNSYNNISQLHKALQDCNAETTELASSVIGSMKTVRSFKAEHQEQQRYEQTLNRKLQILRRKGIYSAIHLLIRRFITVGLKVAMLFQGRNLISSGQLSSGSLFAFVFYQKDMVTNMKHLVYIYGDMLNTVGSAVKVFQLLDRKPQMREAGDLAPEKVEGRLTFEKVTFSYHSRPNEKALKSVTLELSPGKLTALVGPTGGGKTSCVCLLQRFYEPQEGEVLLDEEPLHHYQHQYLHKKVAMVSQDPVLFSGSVRYNIEYGLKDCTLERVKEAARKANRCSLVFRSCDDTLTITVMGPDLVVVSESLVNAPLERRKAWMPSVTVLCLILQLENVPSSLKASSQSTVKVLKGAQMEPISVRSWETPGEDASGLNRADREKAREQ
uniref:Transporter associated with antigen processing, subunit type t, teleost specific n=1 Tax=Sinocyclocheilus anshuiensis TaxID=1608454 RepID=A0A671NKP7_9TELE